MVAKCCTYTYDGVLHVYDGRARTHVVRGKRNVSLVTLQIIARGFGLSVSKLLSKV